VHFTVSGKQYFLEQSWHFSLAGARHGCKHLFSVHKPMLDQQPEQARDKPSLVCTHFWAQAAPWTAHPMMQP